MDWIPTLGDRQAQYRRYRLIAQIVHPVGTHWPRATDRRVATFARDLRAHGSISNARWWMTSLLLDAL